MNKTIIVTGGAGCVGAVVVEHIIRKTNWNVVILDKLSYASNGLARLRETGLLSNPRIKMFTIDLVNPVSSGVMKEIGDVHYIAHLAAESHVDDSIANPVEFVQNNISSTLQMLEYARKLKILERFMYFSTDEVYGSCTAQVGYDESTKHKPSNPYAASKSASEMICLSYANTYKIPLIITNAMNIFTERQHVQKFIPKVIKFVMEDKVVPIHADESCLNAGARSYIHARNLADAFIFIIKNGTVGETYHIGGEKRMDNLAMAKFIASVMGKELKYEMTNFHASRPGHDMFYFLSDAKLRKLGWKPPVDFETSLRKTILWTVENKHWLEE